MKFIIAFALLFSVFANDNKPTTANLNPVVVVLEMTDLPRGYLAQTGFERCKDNYAVMQERADKICYNFGHLRAYEAKFDVMETAGDEALLKAKGFDFIDVEPKVYKCKKERRNRIFLHYTKFVRISCETL